MKQTVNQNDFSDGFKQCGRKDQFSYGALCALFEYFEELEEGTGTEIEFDPIAICCEFSEYGSAEECILDAGYDCDEDQKPLEYLQENTQVIEFSGGIIVINY